MSFDEEEPCTTAEFSVSATDYFSEVRLKRTLTSEDEYVRWELNLCLTSHNSDLSHLNLEATAQIPDTPHIKQFVFATCRLRLKQSSKPCQYCRSPSGSCPHCNKRNVVLVEEEPMFHNYLFKISNVLVPTSSFHVLSGPNGEKIRSVIVEVTLRHWKPSERMPDYLTADEPRVAHNLKALLDSSEMSDVTFIVGGEEVKAHTVILGAHSPVFRAQFQHDTLDRSSRQVTIKDATPKAFKEMLRCLYTDAVPAWTEDEGSDDFLMELLKLADKYDLTPLRRQCERRILCTMTVDNAAERLIAVKAFPEFLSHLADSFARRHLHEILSTEAWTKCMEENVALAAEVMYNAIKKT